MGEEGVEKDRAERNGMREKAENKLKIKNQTRKPGIVIYACNPNTKEAGAKGPTANSEPAWSKYQVSGETE